MEFEKSVLYGGLKMNKIRVIDLLNKIAKRRRNTRKNKSR